ncbi:MAG: response regulator [Planctomycetota bacterium]
MTGSDRIGLLIVDDSELVLEALREDLTAGGFRVSTTSNPLTAAALLRQENPQLLLLDLEMPAIRGTEILEILRRSDALRETQVVLYSDRAGEPEVQELARAAGAAAAMPKTVRGDDLCARLRGLVRRSATTSDRRALLVTTGAREQELRRWLTEAGYATEVRSQIGLAMALRSGKPHVLVLDEEAFDDIDGALERLERRGLLGEVPQLVIGAARGRALAVPREDLYPTRFLRRLREATGEGSDAGGRA